MPVLEKLGLVTSKVAQAERVISDDGAKVTVPVKRYELTRVGLQSYLNKDTMRGSLEHHKDLCAATLTLDQVVRWDESQSTADTREGTLFYTYHVTAVPWALSPDAQKVFPMVDKIIKGEGTLQLAQRMQLGKEGWIAVPGSQP